MITQSSCDQHGDLFFSVGAKEIDGSNIYRSANNSLPQRERVKSCRKRNVIARVVGNGLSLPDSIARLFLHVGLTPLEKGTRESVDRIYGVLRNVAMELDWTRDKPEKKSYSGTRKQGIS